MELYDPALLAFAAEQRQFNAGIMKATEGMGAVDTTTPEGLQWIRDAMLPGGLFGFEAFDFPEVRDIPGPAGPISIRVMTPDTGKPVDGVYLHFHGGGMTLGSALSMDKRNWPIAQACNVALVSVDYRLAPEHPFPAGVGDAEAAARWLIDNAKAEFGTDRLVAGGESAGAYLTMLTMLRLREHLAAPPPFLGLDLCYGVYDWGGTPSARELIGKVPYATGDGANRSHYLPGRSIEQARDPAVSPLWAELHDLPPALLTVGTADWLRDDSIFLAGRLAAAGNAAQLAVYPEGPHGIESSPTQLGRLARERIYSFIRESLTQIGHT